MGLKKVDKLLGSGKKVTENQTGIRLPVEIHVYRTEKTSTKFLLHIIQRYVSKLEVLMQIFLKSENNYGRLFTNIYNEQTYNYKSRIKNISLLPSLRVHYLIGFSFV